MYFNLKRWAYYLFMIIMTMLWSVSLYEIGTNISKIQELFSTQLLFLRVSLWTLSYAFMLADIVIVFAATVSGYIANFSLKLNLYKTHGKLLCLSLLSWLLVGYFQTNWITRLLVKLLCYIYYKFLVSQIYGGVIFKLLSDVPNEYTRKEFIVEFNKLIESDHKCLISLGRWNSLH